MTVPPDNATPPGPGPTRVKAGNPSGLRTRTRKTLFVVLLLAAVPLAGCISRDETDCRIVTKPTVACGFGPPGDWPLHLHDVTLGMNATGLVLEFSLTNVDGRILHWREIGVVSATDSSRWFGNDYEAEIPHPGVRPGFPYERPTFQAQLDGEPPRINGTYITLGLTIEFHDKHTGTVYELEYSSNCYRWQGGTFVKERRTIGESKCDVDVLDMTWPDHAWSHLPAPNDYEYWQPVCTHCYAAASPLVSVGQETLKPEL